MPARWSRPAATVRSTSALQAVAGTGVAFGAIPVGTGNDFVREVGLPTDPVAAAGVIADALRTGRRRRVDLARMVPADGPTRWFGAVLGAGFDAIVNERANRMRFPRGPRRYDVAIVAELLRLRPRPYTMRLDGVEHRLDAVLVAVGNTPAYGGGMRICPAADATDGLLDVVIAGPISRATLMRIKPRVYAGHPRARIRWSRRYRARDSRARRRRHHRVRRRRTHLAAAGDRDRGARGVDPARASRRPSPV